MTLTEWLAIPNPDGTRRRKVAFASKIGVSPTMIGYYAKGTVWPSRETMERIFRETDGQVTANDFLQIEALSQ